jgi:hypothetical protein
LEKHGDRKGRKENTGLTRKAALNTLLLIHIQSTEKVGTGEAKKII